MTALELAEVTVGWGERVVLDAVSLRVAEGERVALVGPNGAGKSTLLSVAAGTLQPARGSVRVFGEVPPGRSVGYVPQQVTESFLPWFSVGENIALPLRLAGASARQCRLALDEVCARFDPSRTLALRARRSALSAGQLQLAALLRACITRPKLLLLDEPFSALHTAVRARAQQALLELGPVTMLLVTHDPSDVAALCERSFVLPAARSELAANGVGLHAAEVS